MVSCMHTHGPIESKWEMSGKWQWGIWNGGLGSWLLLVSLVSVVLGSRAHALSMALSLLSRKNAFEVNFFWERGDIPHIEKWKRKINSSSQSPTSN